MSKRPKRRPPALFAMFACVVVTYAVFAVVNKHMFESLKSSQSIPNEATPARETPGIVETADGNSGSGPLSAALRFSAVLRSEAADQLRDLQKLADFPTALRRGMNRNLNLSYTAITNCSANSSQHLLEIIKQQQAMSRAAFHAKVLPSMISNPHLAATEYNRMVLAAKRMLQWAQGKLSQGRSSASLWVSDNMGGDDGETSPGDIYLFADMREYFASRPYTSLRSLLWDLFGTTTCSELFSSNTVAGDAVDVDEVHRRVLHRWPSVMFDVWNRAEDSSHGECESVNVHSPFRVPPLRKWMGDVVWAIGRSRRDTPTIYVHACTGDAMPPLSSNTENTHRVRFLAYSNCSTWKRKLTSTNQSAVELDYYALTALSSIRCGESQRGDAPHGGENCGHDNDSSIGSKQPPPFTLWLLTLSRSNLKVADASAMLRALLIDGALRQSTLDQSAISVTMRCDNAEHEATNELSTTADLITAAYLNCSGALFSAVARQHSVRVFDIVVSVEGPCFDGWHPLFSPMQLPLCANDVLPRASEADSLIWVTSFSPSLPFLWRLVLRSRSRGTQVTALIVVPPGVPFAERSRTERILRRECRTATILWTRADQESKFFSGESYEDLESADGKAAHAAAVHQGLERYSGKGMSARVQLWDEDECFIDRRATNELRKFNPMLSAPYKPSPNSLFGPQDEKDVREMVIEVIAASRVKLQTPHQAMNTSAPNNASLSTLLINKRTLFDPDFAVVFNIPSNSCSLTSTRSVMPFLSREELAWMANSSLRETALSDFELALVTDPSWESNITTPVLQASEVLAYRKYVDVNVALRAKAIGGWVNLSKSLRKKLRKRWKVLGPRENATIRFGWHTENRDNFCDVAVYTVSTASPQWREGALRRAVLSPPSLRPEGEGWVTIVHYPWVPDNLYHMHNDNLFALLLALDIVRKSNDRSARLVLLPSHRKQRPLKFFVELCMRLFDEVAVIEQDLSLVVWSRREGKGLARSRWHAGEWQLPVDGTLVFGRPRRLFSSDIRDVNLYGSHMVLDKWHEKVLHNLPDVDLLSFGSLVSRKCCVRSPTVVVVTWIVRLSQRALLTDGVLLSLIATTTLRNGVQISLRVCCEGLSFSEQVEIMRSTDILIGVHGAGLLLAIYLDPSPRPIAFASGGTVSFVPMVVHVASPRLNYHEQTIIERLVIMRKLRFLTTVKEISVTDANNGWQNEFEMRFEEIEVLWLQTLYSYFS